jgi:serine/threonine protein kinase
MTTVGQNQTASVAANEIGTVLAQRYEVVRELGRGGMGVVYLCKDVVTGDRVALKRLRSPEKGGPRAAEESWWFHQEARAVSLLDHPAIVRARDFGQLSDGSPFFVMDVLPGRSVHEWMHSMHLPWSVVWAMVDQVLAALAHAHARGVIHGDLKPSNIMLKRTGETKVIDIGSAMDLHAAARRMWSPAYAAPEVLQGGQNTPQSDLASLGYVLIEMLSGRPPFQGLTTYRELIEAKANLETRLPDMLPPEVSCNDLLLHLCRRLVTADPARRFPSAQAADLDRKGAADFHRQLVKGDLASEYENDIRVWLEQLDEG